MNSGARALGLEAPPSRAVLTLGLGSRPSIRALEFGLRYLPWLSI